MIFCFVRCIQYDNKKTHFLSIHLSVLVAYNITYNTNASILLSSNQIHCYCLTVTNRWYAKSSVDRSHSNSRTALTVSDSASLSSRASHGRTVRPGCTDLASESPVLLLYACQPPGSSGKAHCFPSVCNRSHWMVQWSSKIINWPLF